jgi:hypothetical protein
MTTFLLESELTEHDDDVEFVQPWRRHQVRLCNCAGTIGAIGTHVELVATTIEYRIVSDLVRGEGRVDIQLTVLNKKVLVEGS